MCDNFILIVNTVAFLLSEGLTGFWLCESLDSLLPVSRWITVSSQFFENETTKTGIHLSEKGPKGMFL